MPPLKIQKIEKVPEFNGLHYFFNDKDNSFSINPPKEYVIVTANSVFVPELSFLIDITQAVDFDIYENTDVSVLGAEENIIATDRNNLVAPLTKIYAGATLNSDGDLIVSRLLNPNSLSFLMFRNNTIIEKQLVLASNTIYLIRINSQVANNKFQLVMKFFEENLNNE